MMLDRNDQFCEMTFRNSSQNKRLDFNPNIFS